MTLLDFFCSYTAVVMKIFLVFKIFWFHNFDLFQVKVQLIFKYEVDYIMFSIFGLFIIIIHMKLDLIVIYWRLF
jgi:hypothetical protein